MATTSSDKRREDETTEQYWTRTANRLLLNRKIVKVRYMSDEECEAIGFSSKCVVMQLDNGTLIYPSMDDEGNDAGALFSTSEEISTLPVL
jgi:hypothetical protein